MLLGRRRHPQFEPASADEVACQGGLGRKGDGVRHARLYAPARVSRPGLRQVQAAIDQGLAELARVGQEHANLAGLDVGHTGILPRHAGLSLGGIVVTSVVDGSINCTALHAYVDQVLAPELRPGDINIIDDLSSHKGPAIHHAIEAVGASAFYFLPYSPDFNPIESAFPKLKPMLCKATERTVGVLWDRIGIFSTPSRPPNAPTTSEPQGTSRSRLNPH